MLLLLVRLLLIIFILVIVVSLFVLFLILRLLLNLAEVLQLLLIVLYKLIIIAIPLSDFLNLIWVNLHMIQYYWLDIIVIFLHDIFVQQFFFYLVQALHIGIDNFTHLIGITERHDVGPPHTVEFKIEIENEQRVYEVDKCKAYAALCFEIHGQIEVVILSSVVSIQKLEHVCL